MLIVEGSVCGLYWPIVSIVRPSRGERLSATTMRQIGFFFEPTRLSLILTAIGRGRLQKTAASPLAAPDLGSLRPSAGHLRQLLLARHLSAHHRAHHLAHLVELGD